MQPRHRELAQTYVARAHTRGPLSASSNRPAFGTSQASQKLAMDLVVRLRAHQRPPDTPEASSNLGGQQLGLTRVAGGDRLQPPGSPLPGRAPSAPAPC